tara:strand:+ start:771 stop:2246 length:1476 start_codon:yes stop_codon:yes gene_type:complete
MLPGILILEKNKTYGNTKSKYYYKCISKSIDLPFILIPYKLNLSFNKRLKNKYILFKIATGNKGQIIDVIGNTDDIDSFYIYELYCNELSMYMNKKKYFHNMYNTIKNKTIDYDKICQLYNVKNRLDNKIYTIDPYGSRDLDDGFSIKKKSSNEIVISIHITNVSILLDYYNIWELLGDRISTIYLPNKKLHMLPNILSNNLCSLLEHKKRVVLTLDIIIDSINHDIIDYSFSNNLVKVSKNYSYGNKDLYKNTCYKLLYKTIVEMNNKNNYIDNIKDDHDVIAYLMILMNYISSKRLIEIKKGIYRSVLVDSNFKLPEDISSDIKQFLIGWNTTFNKYTNFENYKPHQILKLSSYTQISSPIRRLIDLINMISIQNELKTLYNLGNFYEKWIQRIDYLNNNMKKIKRIQNNTSLIYKLSTNRYIRDHIYTGYVFDKKDTEYYTYLPHFQLFKVFTIDKILEINKYYNFKIFVFLDENDLRQKIKIELQTM